MNWISNTSVETRILFYYAAVIIAVLFTLGILLHLFPLKNTAPAFAADTSFTVTNNNDSGVGSLRQSITNANSATGSVEILVDFPEANEEIFLEKPLPALTHPVTITHYDSEPLRISCDSPMFTNEDSCWELTSGASGSVIRGVIFRNSPGNGLTISGGTDFTIGEAGTSESGVDLTVRVHGVSGNGIVFAGSSSTLTHISIGATYGVTEATPIGERGMVISGDNNTLVDVAVIATDEHGIFISEDASGTVIDGTEIGVSEEGYVTHIAGNGIHIEGDETTVSDTVIGNAAAGIYIHDGADSTTITGSTIGTNSASRTDFGATQDGIQVYGTNTIIGGQGAKRNVISGNARYGILIDGSGTQATGTTLRANDIGLTADGSDALANAAGGIYISDAHNVTIGVNGNADQASHISGNNGDGILIKSSHDIAIYNAQIGVNSANESEPNTGYGIVAYHGSTDIAIGSSEKNLNVIAYNARGGVRVTGAATQSILISHNTFIENGGDAIVLEEDANEAIAQPVINSAGIDGFSGSSASAGGHIELYSGGAFIAATSEIESDGFWTLDADMSAYQGKQMLALSIDASNNTSVFSESIEVSAEKKESEGDDAVPPDEREESDEETVSEDEIASDVESATGQFSYLKPTNVIINTQLIYDAVTAVHVPFNDVRIAGFGARNTHEVRVLIKDQEKKVVDKAWVDVEKQEWKRTVAVDLVKGDTYTVHGKAREEEDHDAVSEQIALATILATNAGPTHVSLKQPFTITAKPENLLFTGLFQGFTDGAVFLFQDRETGDIVDQCTVTSHSPADAQTKSGACRLAATLPVGHYSVLFHSIQTVHGEALLSAPAVTQLIVTRPTAVDVLNTDQRNTLYRNRITVQRENTLVGLGPENSTARIYVSGKEIGQATFTSAIGWTYALNLSGYQQGANYLLEVKFYNEQNREIAGSALYYPIRYAYPVTKPIFIEALPATVLQSSALRMEVVGGSQHLLHVRAGGTEVLTTPIDEQQDGIFARKTISLSTRSLGAHTVTLQSEDQSGLLSAESTYVYSVVAPTPVETEPIVEEEAPPVAEEPAEETPVEQEPAPIESAPVEEVAPIEEAAPVEQTPAVEEVPAVEEPSVPTEDTQSRLNRLNTTNLTVIGSTRQLDASGAVISTNAVEKNSLGETILHTREIIGLRPIHLPWSSDDETTETRNTVTFSGVSDPHAVVTVTIRSEPIVKVTRADAEGKWTMTVPVDALTVGEHTAYLQTESNGVLSDQIEIAKFVVIEEQSISNATWIFIISSVLALVILCIAIVSHVRHQHTKQLS